MALRDSLEFVGNARNLRGRWHPAGNRPGQAGTVAFVFQGGGSLTAPQVGMLRALCEAGLTPDLVLGSSVGAINAVAFATDPGPAGLDRLEAGSRRARAALTPRRALGHRAAIDGAR